MTESRTESTPPERPRGSAHAAPTAGAAAGREAAARSSARTAPGSELQRAFEASLAQAAASAATVLLEGESGVGKGRAASRLHAASARSAGPLVTTSLAALSPTLVEAELFGHEQGAFTGASHARRGRFRQAQGGTLVLDDVAALPVELQAKLLRAIQERVVEPLGSEAPVPVDVRLVATTSLDLAAEVAAGRFREDLFYRLAVICLRVPALRDRRADLPDLAGELLIQLAARHGSAPRVLSEAALQRLLEHPWPGNVRELENALERVLVLRPDEAAGRRPGGSQPIEACELAFLDETIDGAAVDLCRRALAHGLTLDEIERTMLAEALVANQQNISAAARQVGLTRRAFEYRLARARQAEAHDQAEAHETAPDGTASSESGGAVSGRESRSS